MSKRLFTLLLLVVLLFPAIGPNAAAQEARPANPWTSRPNPALTSENAGQPTQATDYPFPPIRDFTGQATAPVAEIAAVLASATQVVAGGDHTCALTVAGGVKCWGANYTGQLGDGTQTSRATPVDVVGLPAGVTALAAGTYHTCAAMTAGGVKCWGANWSGQLGDGTTTTSSVPVDVAELAAGVTALTAGAYHTCALIQGTGGVKCWGDNNYGQLGDGTTTDRPAPADVTALPAGAVAVAAGGYHTCAVTQGAGGVKCWGANNYGQLGDGTTTNRPAPVDVTGLPAGVAGVAAGIYHTCAVDQGSGTVKCWGNNWYGQLGDGTTTNRPAPVGVTGLPAGAASLTSGMYHTCAVTQGTGGVKCWGNNYYGQVGDENTTDRLAPVDVVGLSAGIGSLAAGGAHTCAVTQKTGGVKCWGDNHYGQLGNATMSYRTGPVDVAGLSGITALAANGMHTCVLIQGTGGVKCWGDNHYGQLGDGTTDPSATPIDVTGLATGAAGLATGAYHTCALIQGTGGVRCWGHNDYGQLGDGTTKPSATPVNVAGLSGVTALVAGGAHTCAVMAAGGVKCWGNNDYGQLGDATTTDRTAPVDVIGLPAGVTALTTGVHHTCALTTAGKVKCWGANYAGQLGDGTTTDRTAPVDVTGLQGVANLAAGVSHTCAVAQKAGGVKCWGNNDYGQLGDGTTIDRPAPVDVTGLPAGATNLAAGESHTCAVAQDTGGVKCWGDNWYGQLGDGTVTPSPAPVNVAGLSAGAAGLAAGWTHTCAMIQGTGGVQCWGDSSHGQLGLNPGWTPVQVMGFSGHSTYLPLLCRQQ